MNDRLWYPRCSTLRAGYLFGSDGWITHTHNAHTDGAQPAEPIGVCLLFGLPKRVTPPKSWKPAVVSIRTDPFAPRFDRERCEIRVRDEVAFDACCPAKTGENLPVPGSRGDQNAVWSIAQGVCEREGHLHRARYSEHARMGDHAEKAAQNEIGHPKRGLRPNCLLKPLQVNRVIGSILTISVHEYVDVEEDHRVSSMRLSKAAVSSRSIPG